MIRHFILATSAVLLACAAPPPATAQLPDRIGWVIAPNDAADTVNLTLDYRNATTRMSWSSPTPIADLPGLNAAQLASEASVRFAIAREAGRLDCEGIVRARRGTGDCRFTPDAVFSAELSRRGIGAPSPQQSFNLALGGVGLALVDALERQDYARPSIDDLIAAGVHRITPDYVREMAEAGYRVGAVDGLVELRIHRVTPTFVRDMVAAGAGRFAARELVALRIHRVTPEFVRELSALGYQDLSADDLTSLRIHRISGDFVRGAITQSGRRLSPDELVTRRLHGGRGL